MSSCGFQGYVSLEFLWISKGQGPWIETKFDLQRPFLSGLGSLHGFSGFLGGHGVN